MRRFGGLAVLLMVTSVACDKDVEPTGPIVTPHDTTSTPVPPPPPASPPTSPSPTGVIAFVSQRSGNEEIYTANADGTNLVQLTNNEARDEAPAWSPDGKRIVFMSDRAASTQFDVYTMNADGTNVVRRTFDGKSYDPAWSPDGRRIAFSSGRTGNTLVYVTDVDGDWSKARMVGFPNDGLEMHPAWLPDGKKVAFTSLGGDYTAGLFIANIDGSGIKPLYGSTGDGAIKYLQLWNSAWSPDGTKIAVAACDPFPCLENFTIRVIKSDGTNPVNLKAAKFYPKVTWSPNGSWIAYSEGCSNIHVNCARSIFAMRTDGQGWGSLISDAYSPAWRPEQGGLTTGPIREAPATVIASNAGVTSGNSFVSAASETYRNAAFITMRNRTMNGDVVAAELIGGGFDPVGVAAQSGDEIVLSVLTQGGDSADVMMVKVPPRRPPSVVRTSPAKGRTDVALNVQIEVVFTEPVNPATVNTSTFGVFRGVAAVPGKIQVSSDGLSAKFIPNDALDRNTGYTILMTTGIRDLDGDQLEEQTSSTFTTGNPPLGVIAFVSDRDGNSEIYTVNIDGSGLKRLTNNPARDDAPAWSPDGSRIVFSSDREGGPHLYEMNADGSNVVRRTTTTASTPAWSRDGKKIAYSGYAAGSSGFFIRIADAAGNWSQATEFGAGTTFFNSDPSWSPDGSQIVFASDYQMDDGQEIWIMNSDGTGVRTLLRNTLRSYTYDDGEIYFQPAWSPDGKKIAVVACHFAPHDCHPYSTVSIMNADGSQLAILKFAGGMAHPSWSPDGQFIAFASTSCGVCKKTIRYARTNGTAVDNDVIVEDGLSPAWKP